MHDLTHLSLFSGIGGIDLAAAWANFRTVGQVERDPYALRILRKRFGREIPRWEDIHDFSADDFKRRTGIEHLTLISGGFPCQPFSYAGKRKGKEDDRYLWHEMLRVVRELRPAWVLGENVAGIISLGLDECLADLEDQEYTARAFLIPACGINSPQERKRTFIVAHSDESGFPWGDMQQEISGKTLSAADPFLLYDWPPGPGEESRIPRMAHGVPHRVDRLRCLGNAVVPQQVYPILKAIAQIEEEEMR